MNPLAAPSVSPGLSDPYNPVNPFDLQATLQGPRIRLRPLQADDGPALLRAAADGELWRLPFTVVPSANTVSTYLGEALAGREAGTVMPFATELVATGEVIGTTRFWKIHRRHRKLEIAGTWLAARWQRSFANTEAKYLMLRHAFEVMQCVRVQLTTDEINQRSRAAILRLGAVQEGIARHERIMPDGRKRNSVRFSIIDDEWPQVRQSLLERLVAGGAQMGSGGTE
jgi:N-acetyltransferase